MGSERRRWPESALCLAPALALAMISATVSTAQTTIGRTWTIAEPDALTEIEGRAARVPDMRAAYGPRSRWSAMKAAALGDARDDRHRSIVPFYTLDQDIRLPDGRLVYPKGFTFNPLAYVSLPQRLVVVHPAEIGWALKVARQSDFILVAAGRPGDADPITLTERHGRSIYLLEERVKERLGLTVAPVIVAQTGQKLVLTEIGTASRLAGKGVLQ